MSAVGCEPIPAITVHQPYALMLAIGAKPVENRGRNVNYRGPIAIHAGQEWWKHGEKEPLVQQAWGVFRRTLPADNVALPHLRPGSLWVDFGAIIAVANLVDVHRADNESCSCGPWAQPEYPRGNGFVAAHHLVMEDVRRLAHPVKCRGQVMTLWTPPDDVQDRIREEVMTA